MASAISVAKSKVTWLRNVQSTTRRLRLPWISLVIVAILLICAVFAPLVAPHDPQRIDMLKARMAPGEDLSYPLGTDILGRDKIGRASCRERV